MLTPKKHFMSQNKAENFTLISHSRNIISLTNFPAAFSGITLSKERMKNMNVKKLMATALLIISLCITSITVPQKALADNGTQTAVLDGSQPIQPWDYQKLLGKGMDVDWCKTSQGMQYYRTVSCKNFKQSGVSHVRIRIKDTISDKLFQSLDQQISDCLEYGLIPVIAYQADEFKNEPTEENIQKVVTWWGTVAERYKDRSFLMAFDLLIEATDALNKQPEKLNEIYERIVTEIRKTNPERIIMISPRLRSDAAYLSELKIPTQHNNYLMAEWHFYAAGPSKENERKLWTTGTDAEKKLITDKIQLALDWQEKNNIPTWVGAWMAGNYNDGNDYSVEEQVVFASFMTEQLTGAGIPFAVNSDTKFYDREKNEWVQNMQPVFECIYGKKAISDEDNSSSAITPEEKIVPKVHVGFNAKGNLDTTNQYTYVKKQLSALKKAGTNTGKIYLRLQGGTISQKAYSKDWTESQIARWAKLQNEYKCKYIFVVNLNDIASKQLAFYTRFLKAGIRFSMIELGNEQYLPKFAQSKVTRYDEVTKRTAGMTPSKYIKLSNEYIKAFKKYKLPFYVQFAPDSSKNGDWYKKWNSSMINAINKRKFASNNINGTIHLYERNGAGSLDAKQIASLRTQIKPKINIAVTESGVVDNKGQLTASSYAAQELNLTKRILAQLQPGDTFLNQVLYTNYKTTGSAVLHPKAHGLTVKGKVIMEYLKQYWVK